MLVRISNIRVLVISFTYILLAIIVLAALSLRNNKIVLAVSIKRLPDYFWPANEVSYSFFVHQFGLRYLSVHSLSFKFRDRTPSTM